VERWASVPAATLTAYIRRQLEAACVWGDPARATLKDVIDRLVLLQDVRRIETDEGWRYIRTLPRWIRLTDEVGVLTGTLPDPTLPLLTVDAADDPLAGLVRRFDPCDRNNQIALRQEGIDEWRLAAWIGQPEYVESLRRYAVEGRALSDLWPALEAALRVRGLRIEDAGSMRLLCGPPGGFFGKESAPSGRWNAATRDGAWCAARRADERWLPAIARVAGGQVKRVLDLYDYEERAWALLSRGLAVGAEEVVERDRATVAFTFPLPRQMERVMALVGWRVGPWSWRIPEELPPLWRIWEAG